MFFVKLSRSLVAIALVAILFSSLGCETHNSNELGCFEEDCQASCETKGFEGGSCADQICECQEGNSTPYQWAVDAGTKNDTDSELGNP